MEGGRVVPPASARRGGHARFSRLPHSTARKFQPLHRESCDFPSPAALLRQIGVRDWFAPLNSRAEAAAAKRYCVEKEVLTLPTFALQGMGRGPAGPRPVVDP